MNINLGGSSQISINGKNIKVQGGRVYVNGVEYLPADGTQGAATPDQGQQTLRLDSDGTIKGPITGDLYVTVTQPGVTLRVEGSVTGSVSLDGGGSIQCGDVRGSVNGTDIECGGVGGSANGANITCGNVGGSVNAANVTRR